MHKTCIALSILGMASVANANRGQENCAPSAPATCSTDSCKHCYCLGPETVLVNAPVNPRTCGGDFVMSIAGLYWNTHQDGMEYALRNRVQGPDGVAPPDIQPLNNLIQAEYLTPNFEWNWGFRAGLGYNTTCDGWDLGILWTRYKGNAHDEVETNPNENQILMPLWSTFAPGFGFNLFTYDIETNWNLSLNLIDLELGRNFWTSKYLAWRPFVGLRIAHIDQDFGLQHKGGSWRGLQGTPFDAMSNFVDLKNDFKGVGIRSGLDTTWNFGCGWSLYGDLAASIVYGKFSIRHDEINRLVEAPFSKTKILETKDSFRSSRAMLDLGLGLQWSSMFCDCQYGLTVALGYEQHLFFHQNQLWRVVRNGAQAISFPPNNTGENVLNQRRGTLDTQGVTLSLQFEF